VDYVAIISALSAAVGAVILKLAEGYVSSGQNKQDDLRTFRTELQQNLTQREKDLDKCRIECDRIQSEYYKLREEYVTLKATCNQLEKERDYCRERLRKVSKGE